MMQRKQFLPALAAAFLIGVGSWHAAQTHAQQPSSTADAAPSVEVGSQAPDFSAPTRDGEFKLSDHRGKYVVAVFVRAHW